MSGAVVIVACDLPREMGPPVTKTVAIATTDGAVAEARLRAELVIDPVFLRALALVRDVFPGARAVDVRRPVGAVLKAANEDES